MIDARDASRGRTYRTAACRAPDGGGRVVLIINKIDQLHSRDRLLP